MCSGSFFIFCEGSVVEKQRVEVNESPRKAEMREDGESVALVNSPAIVTVGKTINSQP